VGAPHAGYNLNYRAAGATNSLQINVDTSGTNGVYRIEMDIDPFNPAAGFGPMLEHIFFQMLPNAVTGGDTDYHRVAQELGFAGWSCDF
jgi:hypothetical protein